jgi:hypothetical protein
MLPNKSLFSPPLIIHCPVDHLRMSFRAGMNVYRCTWPGCAVLYSFEKGYYRLQEEGDAKAHPLYIEDFVASRKVRFWVCPVRGCGYEVSQRLEKTAEGWRTCGSFEHTKAVRMRR